MNTAVLIGAAFVAIGAIAALAIPGGGRRQEALVEPSEPLAEAA